MKDIRKKISNMIGHRIDRKIIVFESDDWGSIRTRSKEDYKQMLESGLELDRSNFTKFDCLESNDDLSNLFEVLSRYKDSSGRAPVFTPMCIVANPDFMKIQEKKFTEYHYEKLEHTINKYPNHDKLIEFWREGINNRLFVPGLHGREHLNVARWMKNLQEKNMGSLNAFAHESIGATWYKGEKIPEYLGAFYTHNVSEVHDLQNIVNDAVKLFNELCLYKPTHFIAPNMEPRLEVDKFLYDNGVMVQTMSKLRKYPKDNNKFGFELNWLGKQNKYGQIILTRNCGFEPSSSFKNNWVMECLHEIDLAFKFKKPAIISTHRVNYVGTISKKNSDKGLERLDKLLFKIIKNWPDVEFMTSTELANIIACGKVSK